MDTQQSQDCLATQSHLSIGLQPVLLLTSHMVSDPREASLHDVRQLESSLLRNGVWCQPLLGACGWCVSEQHVWRWRGFPCPGEELLSAVG